MIAERFEAFISGALPPEAPDVQHECMEMAYWAGAAAMFRLVMSLDDPDPDEINAHMSALQAELIAHLSRAQAIDATLARPAN